MKNKILTLALVAIAALGMTSCSKDDDQTDKTTKVYGTITIENTDVWQTWADSGEVQVTIFPEFSLDPPAGWGEVPDNALGPGVPGGIFPLGAPYNAQNPIVLNYQSGKTTYDYEIELEPGTYSALGLGLRHNNVADPTRKTASLGVHWNKPDEVSHGIVIKIDPGNGMFIPIFEFAPPATIQIQEGEQLEFNFKADFDFVNQWYQ
ncbi:MAG TPA: hypothetical protein ENJ45_00965 [Phaeodactylibacter sp.]|nr:hypothetical protein [Phaeodactylibacter sp.]